MGQTNRRTYRNIALRPPPVGEGITNIGYRRRARATRCLACIMLYTQTDRGGLLNVDLACSSNDDGRQLLQ